MTTTPDTDTAPAPPPPLDATDPARWEDLSNLTAEEIDALPFGYIALAPDGTIRKYNRYEADLSRRDPREVLGRNFFQEVAPCTQVREFEGRFADFVADPDGEPTLSFDFAFRFRHGTRKVRIGFVRSPLKREIIVTVNRRRERDLPASARVDPEPSRGALLNASGNRVVACSDDFWRALEALFEGGDGDDRHHALHRLGRAWARRHLDRAEGLVQSRHSQALREVELQVALEVLSGSLGVLGLGLFDVDFAYRDAGLLLIEHHDSPFVAALGEREDGRCDLLAGLHAGFFSYLAGRELTGRELDCSQRSGEPCRFLVGTAARLERLFAAGAGSHDAALLARLRDGAGAGPARSAA